MERLQGRCGGLSRKNPGDDGQRSARDFEEPNLFGGKALTYYGRWTYKFEEAARMGAAGVILIHTTESAGYGWNVVRTSNGGWRFDIARTPNDKTPFLQMRSWMTEETASKIFAQAGKNLDQLTRSGETPRFSAGQSRIKGENRYQKRTQTARFEQRRRHLGRRGRETEKRIRRLHCALGSSRRRRAERQRATRFTTARSITLRASRRFWRSPKRSRKCRKRSSRNARRFIFLRPPKNRDLLGAEWYARKSACAARENGREHQCRRREFLRFDEKLRRARRGTLESLGRRARRF